jgi:hypothetical protein
MKKLIIITVIVLFGFSTVYAQDINFGAKAGVNFASITGDDTDDLDGRTSFHVGIVAEIVISDKFSVQPELVYSNQGATSEDSYTEEGINIMEEGTVKLDYINLPVMAKFYVGEGFSLEAGPQIGFLMNSEIEMKLTANGAGISESISVTEDLKDYVKGIDFGVNFGVGYKMENGLNFGARYNLGLSDGNDDPEFFESNTSFKNSVIQVSVGYFF